MLRPNNIRSLTIIGLVVSIMSSLLGCSEKAPPTPDYGDSSLIVEGTEIWQEIRWGWRSKFNQQDKNDDERIDVAEFTAGLKREEVSQRALKIFGILDQSGDDVLTYEEYRESPGSAIVISLDADGSGKLSADEYAVKVPELLANGRLEACFATIDQNGDGELSSVELDVKPCEMAFFLTDLDGDQRISMEESLKKSPWRGQSSVTKFQRRDLNRDENLTLRELLYDPQDAKYWAMDQGGDMIVSEAEYASSRYARSFNDSQKAFQNMDSNSDGILGLSEFRNRSEDATVAFGKPEDLDRYDDSVLFPLLDLDGNGSISPDEMYAEDVPTNVYEKFQPQFVDMDADQNGLVSLSEFEARDSYFRYPAFDKNRDGVLDPEEFSLSIISYVSPGRCELFFEAADLDHDGSIALTEYQGHARSCAFLMEDADEDDRLSLEEFSQDWIDLVADGRIKPAFQSYDVDGDGSLDQTEFDREPPMMRFLEFDADANGRLTLTEFSANAKTELAIAERHATFARRDGDGDGSLAVREFFYEDKFAPFWEIDADQDDRVSLIELLGSPRFAHAGDFADNVFRDLDHNGNGQCEFSEYESRSDNIIVAELDRDKDRSLSISEFYTLGFSTPGRAETIFMYLDADSNDRLSIEEFKSRPSESVLETEAKRRPPTPQAAFESMDVDADGLLVIDELATEDVKENLGEIVSTWFAEADSDADSALALAEFKASRKTFEFLIWDADNNGTLNVDEFHNAKTSWSTRRRASAMFDVLDQDDDAQLNRAEANAIWNRTRFMNHDRNEDNIVTWEEFSASRHNNMSLEEIEVLFNAYDADGDGLLDSEEMREKKDLPPSQENIE